jgi:saccharopine dehydrogenase-like NADP-dependent oxidoreductase
MASSPEDIVPTPNIDSKADKDRGVLLALRNAASFYQGGKIVNVAGPELMAEAKPYAVYPGFAFVAYPNRDSTIYKERSVSTNFLLDSLGV